MLILTGDYIVKKMKNEGKEKHVTPFLPKVEQRKKVRKKNRCKSKLKKENKPAQIKEFEPFAATSAYGRFMANPASKQRFSSTKFRTTVTTNTATDFTCPILPNCLSRGVVPSPLDYDTIPEKYKTKTTQLFESKIRADSNSTSRGASNPKTSRLNLYIPGANKKLSPKVFKKLVLNSHRDKLPSLK